MTNEMTTTQAVARRLASAFRVVGPDDAPRRIIVPTHADAETVGAMVRAADAAGLGHDWQYQAVSDVLDWISDTGETDTDAVSACADALTDVYNRDLVDWLASAPFAHGELCNEAAQELGAKYDDIFVFIARGQWEGYYRAATEVVACWPTELAAADA